jgi:hypothetical protein
MNVFSIIVVLALAISTTAQQVASPKITKNFCEIYFALLRQRNVRFLLCVLPR